MCPQYIDLNAHALVVLLKLGRVPPHVLSILNAAHMIIPLQVYNEVSITVRESLICVYGMQYPSPYIHI